MQYYEGEGKTRYYESPAWGEWCRRVYGIDLKQIGAVTKEEMEIFYDEVKLSPSSLILDVGCGPGYISAEIAKHYSSAVVGIDIDQYAIAHANETFYGNPLLNFQVADGNALSFDASSFDLIYSFDTLYFAGSAEKLRSLLSKYLNMLKTAGKLVVFWSSNKMDVVQKPNSEETQVGLWGIDNNIPFQAIDLTESNRCFWRKAMAETLTMKAELSSEIPETYNQVFNECIHAEKNISALSRWLYIFSKQ